MVGTHKHGGHMGMKTYHYMSVRGRVSLIHKFMCMGAIGLDGMAPSYKVT